MPHSVNRKDTLTGNNVVLAEHALQQELGTGWCVRCFDSLGSTMDAARDLISAPALVLANRMTAGRGRQGRIWSTPPGALLMTLRFETSRSIADLAGLSLMVAVIVREFLAARGVPVVVKWPNDIILKDRRKLGGILIEVSAIGGVSAVLIGVGLNLAAAPENVDEAAALAEFVDEVPSVSAVAVELAERLGLGFGEFERSGFGAFRDHWLRGAFGIGERWVVEEGGNQVSGTMRGVDAIGRLILETTIGTKLVAGGHVVSIKSSEGSHD